MIKAGIFDVGGVLHSNEMAYVHEDISQTLGITNNQMSQALQKLIGPFQKGEIEEEEFWKWLIKETNAPGKLPQESLYIREFKKRFKRNIEMLQLLDMLKHSGYKLAVLSNTIKPHADFLADEKMYEVFDIKVLSHEVGLVKPDAEIYLYTLKKLQILPEEAFFVDDVEENIKAARLLGIHGILYTTGDSLKEQLLKLDIL